MKKLYKILSFIPQFKVYKFPFLIFLLLFEINVKSQSNIDTILANIAVNNKTILAKTQYWEVQKLQYKTGLMPPNPSVDYDYLIGKPSTAGNQTDFTVTQAFDFPSSYIKKKQLSEKQIGQAAFQLTATRQEILFDAKITCIELVYRNKLHSQLSQRKQNTEKLLNDFQTKLDKGEGNILDVNKARLRLIESSNEFYQNVSLINQLNQKLLELNGGNALVFVDTIYFKLPDIPEFEELENEIEKNDPVQKILEQEKLISQKQIELSKAMSLPKLETGYHYQGILGQVFQGVHLGVTIPLWENKNMVKMQESKLLYSDQELQVHRNEHYYEIKQEYEKYSNLKITLQQYQSVFLTLNSTALLNKSLLSGQISTIEYFMEMSYYYNAFNTYLQTEKEYYTSIAKLYRYQL